MRVQRRRSRPGVAHALLAVDVGLIVGQQHVVVVVEQRVDERLEQLAVAVGEERRCRSGRASRAAPRFAS